MAMKEKFLRMTAAKEGYCAHLLNGSCLLERAKNWLGGDARLYAFNEAMCQGDAAGKIFSEEFIEKRVVSLRTTRSEYERTVISALNGVLNEPALVLWFGEDMFCQINFITVLAWLDENRYAGDVFFCKLEESKDDLEEHFYPVEPQGYAEIFRQVVTEKRFPTQTVLPVTHRAIGLYLSYREESGPIAAMIRAFLNEPDLPERLLAAFPEYGLGDLQYTEMIEEAKKRR